MSITEDQLITATKNIILPNKGISLQEESILKTLPPLAPSKGITAYALVRLARKHVIQVLGRENITPRDLKKAVFRLIDIN